jgi:hypothetical protein
MTPMLRRNTVRMPTALDAVVLAEEQAEKEGCIFRLFASSAVTASVTITSTVKENDSDDDKNHQPTGVDPFSAWGRPLSLFSKGSVSE